MKDKASNRHCTRFAYPGARFTSPPSPTAAYHGQSRTMSGMVHYHELDAIKARFNPGDTVTFQYKGRRLTAMLTRLGRTRAHVTGREAQRYQVAYARLCPEAAAPDYAPHERASLAIARELLDTHGLSHWRVGLDDAVSRAAVCQARQQRIQFARLYLRQAPPPELRDTILHEIAHALVGAQHQHDAVWRAKARAIGCSGTRCHQRQFSQPQWIARCPNGCFAITRNRRAAGTSVCRQCRQPVEFLRWHAGWAARTEASANGSD